MLRRADRFRGGAHHLVRRPRSEIARGVAGGAAPQRLLAFGRRRRLLGDRPRSLFEMALEPVVDRDPQGIRKAVRQGRFDVAQPAGGAHHGISPRQLLKLLPPAGLIRRRVGAEEVAGAGGDQQRLRRHRPEKVPAVEPERAGAGEILLGIVGGAGREERMSGEVLGVSRADHGRGQPVVGARQHHGEGAAAGLPGGAQLSRVHLRMRGQHVQAAYGVPQLHARGGLAHQQHLPPGNRVLVIGGRQPRQPAALDGVRRALALPHGVEGQHDVAELREPLAASLVVRIPFAVVAVPHLKQNARVGRPALLRKVEIRRDDETRARLVDQLLDAVGGALEPAHRARVQGGRPRQPAGEFLEGSARPRLVAADVGGRMQCRDTRVAPGVRRIRQGGQIIRQASRVLAVVDLLAAQGRSPHQAE